MDETMENTKIPTSKSIEKNLRVVETDRKYIAAGQAIKYFPLVVARAQGSRIWDLEGNEFIDFLSSAASFNVGHNHPEVIKAVEQQMRSFINYTIAYLYTEPSANLAKLLADITPGDFEKKVAFGLSGGDAVDSAIKLSRASSKKKNIIVYDQSYHGNTYGAISSTMVTPQNKREKVFPIKEVSSAQFPNPYRNKWGIDGYERPDDLMSEALDDLKKVISSLNGEVATLIAEPIQGDAGIIIPPNDYFKEVRKICDENNILFTDEEVQTGMGRTGTFWAIDHFNVVPDLVVSAKALGSGLPISAVIGRKEILDSLPSPMLVFTHAAQAMASSAALATIKTIRETNLAERAAELEKYAIKRLEELKKYDQIGDVRGKGLMLGVEIVKSRETKEPTKLLALKIIWRAWEKGLLLTTLSSNGNVLRIAPPLNISKEDLDRAIDILGESVKDAIDGKVPDDVSRFMAGW